MHDISGVPVIKIEVERGDGPLVLGLPHTGTKIPPPTWHQLNEVGRAMSDTDWHIDQLYWGLLDNVTTVRTPVHRYAIDVNRDPNGASLYPGQNTTGLCPITDFDGNPIYQLGMAPSAEEIADRRDAYHRPYHDALQRELDRVRQIHGHVILYDCHSIRSEIPFLFPGILPDFNIGTDGGKTCDASIEALVHSICARATPYTSVLNGRFRGGWTTRHYAQPDSGVHSIQMELAQSSYLTEHAPCNLDRNRAEALQIHLREILQQLANWRP